jgi:signal transduction histidine kinase
MTQSHPTSGQDLSLTIVNHIDPRVVFAAPVNIVDDTIDILYVDLPADQSPDAMFDFVEAVSRQINYIQKNLFYQELQITAKALREANAALKDKDRIKDEYVSRITHDIKGHLGVIKSSLAIADDHSGIGSPEDKVKFIGRASDRTTQLLEFIAELLRITKLRLGGQMVETTFSLKDAITKSLETVAPGARDKLISLKANVTEDIDIMIGDELSITEVITNLLFNAIKYSPENESVTLQAMVEHDQVLITISDTGIGIPPEEVDQVFQEFFRASNAITFAKDGTGLGLALVKQIVERHGGTITAKNNTGKGAVFSIVLPI